MTCMHVTFYLILLPLALVFGFQHSFYVLMLKSLPSHRELKVMRAMRRNLCRHMNIAIPFWWWAQGRFHRLFGFHGSKTQLQEENKTTWEQDIYTYLISILSPTGKLACSDWCVDVRQISHAEIDGLLGTLVASKRIEIQGCQRSNKLTSMRTFGMRQAHWMSTREQNNIFVCTSGKWMQKRERESCTISVLFLIYQTSDHVRLEKERRGKKMVTGKC